MANHVDTVSISVTGLDLVVQEFVLSAAVNDVPSILLRCLPVDSAKGKTEASKPTVAILRKKYEELLEQSLDGETTASVDIKVESGDAKSGCGQSVTLKDWILTDVGLTSISTSSAPYLTVVLKHPAVRLTRTGEIYEAIVSGESLDQFLQDVSGGDMVEFHDDLLSAIASSDGIEFYDVGEPVEGGVEDGGEKVVAAREALMDDLPSKYLEGKGGLFLETVGGNEVPELLNKALASIMMPSFGSVSTWYVIVRSICATCLMHVRPTYDEKTLKLEPLQPWDSTDEHEIQEDMIESIELPGRDPDPICGVAVAREDTIEFPTYDTGNNAYREADPNVSEPKCCKYSYYIPEKAQPGKLRWGRILSLGHNQVISSICLSDGGGDSEDLTNQKGVVEADIRAEMEDTYAKALFECLYRKNVMATVTTTLAFSDAKGNRIYPGEIVSISAESDHLFRGYVYKMTVSGSTSTGCRTKLELSYVRGAGNGDLLVEEGAKNKCYSD